MICVKIINNKNCDKKQITISKMKDNTSQNY